MAIILGGKHPRASGPPGRDVCPEIWGIVGPMLREVVDRGEATWSEDQLLLLWRQLTHNSLAAPPAAGSRGAYPPARPVTDARVHCGGSERSSGDG
jgi:hypothetical protein